MNAFASELPTCGIPPLFEEVFHTRTWSSFRNYFKEQFCRSYEQTLYEKLNDWLAENPAKGGDTGGTTPGHIKARRINFYRKSEKAIYVDVLLDADIRQIYSFEGNLHTAVEKQRFYIRSHIDLEQGPQMGHVIDEIGMEPSTLQQPGPTLDEYLIPHMKDCDLEFMAKEMLSKYYPQALVQPSRRLGRNLARQMQLNVIYRKLSKDHSTRGQFFFDGDWIPDYTKPNPEHSEKIWIPKNAVVVDREACADCRDITQEALINDTIVHECIHAYMHYLFYLGQRICRQHVASVACSVPGFKDSSAIEAGLSMSESRNLDIELAGEHKLSSKSPVGWVEWQACKLTPRVTMPDITVQRYLEHYFEQAALRHRNWSPTTEMEHAILQAAKTFGVSPRTAKQRFMELGFDQAKGVLNHVDGKSIPGYGFARGSLEPNETYDISFNEALELAKKDSNFMGSIRSGNYIYIEGHFCLNTKKYVAIRGGLSHMTDYARNHMDECCLVFCTHCSNYGHLYSLGSLKYSKVSKDIETEFRQAPPAPNRDYRSESEQVFRIAETLPGTSTKTLIAHMKRLHCTIEQLVDRSNVSHSEICLLRKDESHVPQKHVAAAICVGLHLHPYLQKDWYHKLGISFGVSEKDILLEMVISSCYMLSIDEVNMRLIANGGEPLTRCTR